MKKLKKVEALRARIEGRAVIASVSGGKDSTAMALALMEADIPFTPVFMDTGWEDDATYEYIDSLTQVVGPIVRLTANIKVPEKFTGYLEELEALFGRPSQMIRLSLRKQMFPARQQRFCTGALKIDPLVDYLTTLEEEPINATGIRREESRSRATLDEWEFFERGDCWAWRPIIDWTLEDVINIHKRHEVAPNPLYLRGAGAERVGCYPCIYARKAEIREIAKHSPDRIAFMKRFEEVLSEMTGGRRAWFTPRGPNSLPFSIEKVVAWAQTSRGGRQFELFSAADRDRGCVRWGMCDTGGSHEKTN